MLTTKKLTREDISKSLLNYLRDEVMEGRTIREETRIGEILEKSPIAQNRGRNLVLAEIAGFIESSYDVPINTVSSYYNSLENPDKVTVEETINLIYEHIRGEAR